METFVFNLKIIWMSLFVTAVGDQQEIWHSRHLWRPHLCKVCRVWLPESSGLSRPLPPPKMNTVTGKNKKNDLSFSNSNRDFSSFFTQPVPAVLGSRTFGWHTWVYRTSPSYWTPSSGTCQLGRSAAMQGCYQIATLFVTLAIAISGGLVTGNHCLLSLEMSWTI